MDFIYEDAQAQIDALMSKFMEAGAVGILVMYTTNDPENLGGRHWKGNAFACEAMAEEMKDQFRQYNRTRIAEQAKRECSEEGE